MSSNSLGALIVQVEDVSHRFPETDLLYEHVNFELETGQTLAVTGPSGSGKSTLLSLVAGWEKPYSGRVGIRKGSRVCWVFQNPYGPKYRTVRDIASFPFIAHGMPRPQANEKAEETLVEFGLKTRIESLFCDLSGGEAQRLMLVRAICCEPDLLLVDEPTAQLDMRSAHQVADSLRLLADRGMAVVIATHDPFVWQSCDRVLNLEEYVPLSEEGVHALA